MTTITTIGHLPRRTRLIDVACPTCFVRATVCAVYEGRKVRCRHCRFTFRLTPSGSAVVSCSDATRAAADATTAGPDWSGLLCALPSLLLATWGWAMACLEVDHQLTGQVLSNGARALQVTALLLLGLAAVGAAAGASRLIRRRWLRVLVLVGPLPPMAFAFLR